MKLGFAAVSALTLMSLGAANAAVTGYSFDGPTTGSVVGGGAATVSSLPQGGSSNIASGDVPFGGALTALGISSTSLSATTAGHPGGVVDNGGGAPAGWGSNSFDTGWLGSLTLNFASPITSFAFEYWETEGAGGQGFTLAAFTAANGGGSQVGSTQTIGFGFGLPASIGGGNISSVVITDLGDAGHTTGDGVRLDNFSVTSPDVVTPEPSTYLMIGSALAGLAVFRRRRA